MQSFQTCAKALREWREKKLSCITETLASSDTDGPEHIEFNNVWKIVRSPDRTLSSVPLACSI